MGQQHSGARTPTAIEQEVYDKNLSALRYTAVPSGMKQRFDYVSRTDGQPVYIGWAASGLAEGSAGWLIHKYTYNVSDQVTEINVYGATSADSATWTGRAGYSYD